MSQHRMHLGDWGPLLDALESLIMRCAALESILESDEPMLYQTHLSETLGEPPRAPCIPVPLRNSATKEATILWLQSHATAEAAPTSPDGASCFSSCAALLSASLTPSHQADPVERLDNPRRGTTFTEGSIAQQALQLQGDDPL